MEIELNAEAKDRRLNRLVAVTVVVLSVFTGLCNIKDGNLVQAMQQAKADSVDTWGEYQATKTKLHVAQSARDEIAVIAAGANDEGKARAMQSIAALDAQIAKYNRSAPALAAKAKGFADQYDAFNVHDDQFDASEGLISAAISMAAVAALAESFALLFGSWAFGAFGTFMGVCGFVRLAFHPDVLSNFLG
jgi:hypothetical protein